MVLESLSDPFRAEAHPVKMMVIGFFYSLIAIGLSLWIFHDQASLIMVFLTTLAATPFLYNTIRFEEKKELSDVTEGTLLKEHWKALSSFMYLFIGVTLACAFCYVVSPADTLAVLFKVQTDTIIDINSNVTGFSVSAFSIFAKILGNNLKVLIFCILFSFLYGVGAIFILIWNASVIGTAIGNLIRTEIYNVGSFFGMTGAVSYFKIISLGLFRYSIHGIPEILSYFVAGLAGGIISTAVIKHDFGSINYEKIIFDSSVLLLLSFVLVVIAAFLEVYVTPYLVYMF